MPPKKSKTTTATTKQKTNPTSTSSASKHTSKNDTKNNPSHTLTPIPSTPASSSLHHKIVSFFDTLQRNPEKMRNIDSQRSSKKSQSSSRSSSHVHSRRSNPITPVWNSSWVESVAIQLQQEMLSWILCDSLMEQCNMHSPEKDISLEKTNHSNVQRENAAVESEILSAFRTILLASLESIHTHFPTSQKKKNHQEHFLPWMQVQSSVNGPTADHDLCDVSSSVPSFQILMVLSCFFFYIHHENTLLHDSISTLGTSVVSIMIDILQSSHVEDVIVSVICWWLGQCVGYMLKDKQDQTTRRMRTEKNRSSKAHELVPPQPKDDIELDVYHLWKEQLCSTSIRNHLLSRMLQDKSQMVRLSSILASSRFFSYSLTQRSHDSGSGGMDDTMESVLQSFLYCMTNDTSYQNRSMGIRFIPMTRETIPVMIGRIRDVHVKVRTEALDTIRTKVDFVQDLTIPQRNDILQYGLTERCTLTYEATIKMLCCSWMKRVKFDPIEFLRLLHPELKKRTCQNAIQSIITVALENTETWENPSHPAHILQDVLCDNEVHFFKQKVLETTSFFTCASSSSMTSIKHPLESMEGSDRDENDTSIPQLESSKVFYQRILVKVIMESKHLSENQKAEKLSTLLPDIPTISMFIRRHIELLSSVTLQLNQMMESNSNSETYDLERKEEELVFTCLEILQLVELLDLKEEGSRRYMSSTIHDILCSLHTHEDIIESCVRVMIKLHDSESDFIHAMSELLSDVNELDSTHPNSIYCPSNKLKDAKTIRTIEIISVTFELVSRKMTSNPTLLSFSDMILSAVKSQGCDSYIRETAVEALGRYALLADEQRVTGVFVPLLLEIAGSNKEQEEVRIEALLALCDLSFLYAKILSPTMTGGKEGALVSYPSILQEFLFDFKSSLAIVSAECVAKLHANGRLHDSDLLAQLIMIFFHYDIDSIERQNSDFDIKDVGNPSRLHQLLVLFFPLYSMTSEVGRESFIGCIPNLLRLIHRQSNIKQKGKKAMVWPITKMIDYVRTCTKKNSNNKVANDSSAEQVFDENDGEEAIALSLTDFILEECSNLSVTLLRTLCKILGSMHINVSSSNRTLLRSLQTNLEDVAMIVTDQSALDHLVDLASLLAEVSLEDNDDIGPTVPKKKRSELNDHNISSTITNHPASTSNADSITNLTRSMEHVHFLDEEYDPKSFGKNQEKANSIGENIVTSCLLQNDDESEMSIGVDPIRRSRLSRKKIIFASDDEQSIVHELRAVRISDDENSVHVDSVACSPRRVDTSLLDKAVTGRTPMRIRRSLAILPHNV